MGHAYCLNVLARLVLLIQSCVPFLCPFSLLKALDLELRGGSNPGTDNKLFVQQCVSSIKFMGGEEMRPNVLHVCAC